jgi:hypothetical protein
MRNKRGGKERATSLRSEHPKWRGGNAARWKAWKTPRASFPLFPPGLEIRQNAAGFPHFHRAGGGLIYKKGNEEEMKELNSS